MKQNLDNYRFVQAIARRVLSELERYLQPGLTEQEIAAHCRQRLVQLGATSFWYHDIAALVLVGPRTMLSVSGAHYAPTTTVVRHCDLVTIDLSPTLASAWGDCARSYIVGRGNGNQETYQELQTGLTFEQALHGAFFAVASTGMTFSDLFEQMNSVIERADFVNLDYRKNLGHTLASTLDGRQFIERGSTVHLEEGLLFTFEPHVARRHGSFGFKYEEVYAVTSSGVELI